MVNRKPKQRVLRGRGKHLGHYACTLNNECSSSDGMSVYEHDDGSKNAFCWVCKGKAPNFDLGDMQPVHAPSKEYDPVLGKHQTEEIYNNLYNVSNTARRVPESVYDFYGCRMELTEKSKKKNGAVVPYEYIDSIYYPTYRDKELVGYRERSRFLHYHDQVKKGKVKEGTLKRFGKGVGDTRVGIEMFGQHLFPSKGKRVILTCGEEDAMAAYYMTSLCTKFEGGYPCISMPSGENIAHVRPNLTYISSFEQIILIYDNDSAGKKFKDELCRMLPIGKVYTLDMDDVKSGCKDPSDLLQSCKNRDAIEKASKKFYNALFNATEKYSPVGIKGLSEGWDDYLNSEKNELIPFPDSFGDINKRLNGGFAIGDIITLAGASSVGKTSFVKAMMMTILQETSHKIGVISLEESFPEFIEILLSTYMEEPLNQTPLDMRDRAKEKQKFNELCNLNLEDNESERIVFLDEQGSCASGDELLEKIDYLINGAGCKIIFLDPFTLATSGMKDLDEDDLMSEILKRVTRHNLTWVNICHVRKNSNGGQANSEGADLAEEDCKGSGSIFQVSKLNIMLMRNKTHENEVIKNTTKIKITKCRRLGRATGIAGYSWYNPATGCLEKGQDPEQIEKDLKADGVDYEDPALSGWE